MGDIQKSIPKVSAPFIYTQSIFCLFSFSSTPPTPLVLFPLSLSLSNILGKWKEMKGNLQQMKRDESSREFVCFVVVERVTNLHLVMQHLSLANSWYVYISYKYQNSFFLFSFPGKHREPVPWTCFHENFLKTIGFSEEYRKDVLPAIGYSEKYRKDVLQVTKIVSAQKTVTVFENDNLTISKILHLLEKSPEKMFWKFRKMFPIK